MRTRVILRLLTVLLVPTYIYGWTRRGGGNRVCIIYLYQSKTKTLVAGGWWRKSRKGKDSLHRLASVFYLPGEKIRCFGKIGWWKILYHPHPPPPPSPCVPCIYVSTYIYRDEEIIFPLKIYRGVCIYTRNTLPRLSSCATYHKGNY